MDSFYINGSVNKMGNVITNLKELFRAHREVWGNESYRTNTMLSTREGGINYNGPRDLAYAIVALENYDGSGDFDSVIRNRVSASKMRDLLDNSPNRRDVLKFCEERSLLMVCSRCRTAQYCSRKCHVADWSRHKGYCDECVELVEQQGATNN